MEVSGQLHAPVTSPPGKRLWYPLERRLGGTQSQYGCNGEEKKFHYPFWKLNPACPIFSIVYILTELLNSATVT